MKAKLIIAVAGALAVVAIPALAQSNVVTIYSADGLHDGSPNWFQTEFDAFTKATGIKVQYIEAGSGGVVDRLAMEKSNPQADVLVTLPPFMQKAAADGLLQPFKPTEWDKIPAEDRDPKDRFVAMMGNYPNYIYNAAVLKEAPKTYNDLLAPQFKGKIQYSTPGQAGDGTAMLLQVFHAYGSKQAGLAYMKKLQANNVGPSASTGKLTGLVNKGELYVANGDLQMNAAQKADNPNIKIFFLAGPNGRPTAFSLPYYIGLTAGAPHAANGKKLIDFLLSAKAQQEASSLAYGFPVRSDVHPSDAHFKQLQAALHGVEIWNPNWTTVLADLKQDVAAYNQAISGQ